VQEHFWKEHLCALQVFFCALVSWLVCTHTHAQLKGTLLDVPVTVERFCVVNLIGEEHHEFHE